MSETNANIFKAIDAGRGGTTFQEVVAQLREMIHRGQLRPGDRLPPERDLAKLLGVSRPTLRAGIRSLAAVGVLQSRQGAGTFVVKSDRSEEHTSELQYANISYAVFCLKKKKKTKQSD